MPTWSDLYHLIKSRHGQSIPPIENGVEVTVHGKLKRPKEIYYGGIKYFVKVISVKKPLANQEL
jgi:hypothetical protein